jgi:hypothetical protein
MVAVEQNLQVQLKNLLLCFSVTYKTPNLETSFIKDSNSDGKSSFSS